MDLRLFVSVLCAQTSTQRNAGPLIAEPGRRVINGRLQLWLRPTELSMVLRGSVERQQRLKERQAFLF